MTTRFHFALLVALFAISEIAIAQARLSGYVTEQNSGKKRVPGVRVKSLFANELYTGNDGQFILAFQNQQPGATVNVEVEKTGWEVVNPKELATALLEKPEIKPLKVIMCVAGQLDKSRMAYYQIGEKYIRDEYERRMKTLDHQKTGWQQKAALYEQELSVLQKQLHDVADEYSRLNLDDLTAIELKAVQLFKEGKIDESIKLRESLNSEQELKKALRRKATEDSIIVANTRNMLALAKEYQLKFDFAKAEATLEKLALTDTTNQENTFQFAFYLQKQNQYDKAINWYQINLKHSLEEVDLATTQNNLGNLYSDKHEFGLAEKAYLRALEVYERLAKTNPQTFEPDVAMTQNNLGVLYQSKHEFGLAEKAYLRALEIRERLVKINPQTFEPNVATTQNNLGVLYQSKHEFGLAEKAYLRALEVYERLAKTNPQTFEPNVAATQNNLGILYRAKHEFGLARKAYLRALEVYERLAKTNPDVYEIGWCRTVILLGYLQQEDFKVARQESLNTQLAEARQKLQRYSNVPLATQLIKMVAELQEYFRVWPVNSAIRELQKRIE